MLVLPPPPVREELSGVGRRASVDDEPGQFDADSAEVGDETERLGDGQLFGDGDDEEPGLP